MCTLKIELPKITANAREIVKMCARYGIEVVGVTKGAAGCQRSPRRCWMAGSQPWPIPA